MDLALTRTGARRAGLSVLTLVAGLAVAVTAESPAVAATVHTQTAHKTSTTPKKDGNCDVINSPGYPVGGVACFKASGDHWYIQDLAADGDRLEVRGVGRWGGNTGFRCIDNAGKAAGWTVCDFASTVKENSAIAWQLIRYHNGKAVEIGETKVSKTS